MSGAALGLVLAAAVFHATWNALAKRARSQLCFLWLAIAVSTVCFAPFAIAPLWHTGVPAGAWPYVAATIAVHALYFYTLGRAYRSGEFSVVYPVARGLGVALVPVIAVFVFGERLSPLGTAGVVLVIAGILMLQLAGRGVAGVVTRLAAPGAGTWWALLTGLSIATYSLVDKAGVARLHPAPYIALMFVGIGVVLVPVVLRDPAALRREWRLNRVTIVVAAAMTLTAYLLVLFALRLSKAGYVVAAREVSIVLSAVIGSVWFREGALRGRLAGAAVVLAGVVCVALAR
jgi:drug/metabolite transporter (DMT)-like permease